MKREEILRRAGYLFTNEVAKSVFIEGAQWRIDSVWHDWKDEQPECGKHAVTDEWIDFIAEDEKDLKRIVKSYGNGKWAYVDDLLPDT